MVEAVNRVQATRWRINTRVFEVMQALMDLGVAVGKIPAPVRGRPQFSFKRATTNAEKYQVYRERDKRAQQRAMYAKAKATWEAAHVCLKEVGEGPIWFPHQLDWRGRFYAIPEHLNPQGPDYARALLMFAEDYQITTQEQAKWLAVHGANCYGINKVDFEEREQWIKDHESEVQAAAADPIGFTFWRELEVGDPWQFLAFCFEWADFKRVGFGFVSRLPIAMDGTCNALQHYALLLKDVELGKLVNLINSPKPQDMYEHIAQKVRGRVRSGNYVEWFTTKHEPDQRENRIPKTKPAYQAKATAKLDKAVSTAPRAAQQLQGPWSETGITRKMLKSPVMTYCYGSEGLSRWQSLREFLRDDECGAKEPVPRQNLIQQQVIDLSAWSGHNLGS